MAVGFRRAVFEDARIGGIEEMGCVDVGFGAEGEEGGRWGGEAE